MASPTTSDPTSSDAATDAEGYPREARAAGIWQKSAPRDLTEAYRARNDEAGWEVWRRHLAKRREPREPARLFGRHVAPLQWALPDEFSRSGSSRDTAAILLRLEQLNAKKSLARYGLDAVAHAWLGQGHLGTCDATRALESLAWCHALPNLSAILSAALWWELFDHLAKTAERAAGIDCGEDPLAEQLLCCELPLTLAYLFPELTQCAELAEHGRRELSEGLSNFLDDDGLPNGQHLAILRPLLACWTRCWAMARVMNRNGDHKTTAKQYRNLVRQVLRLSRRDGSQVLSSGRAGEWNAEFIHAAIALADDRTTRRLAQIVLPKGNKKNLDTKGLPQPAAHSEWAELAMLRPKWSRGGRRLTVNYHGRQTAIELDCGSDLVLSGIWDLQISFNGEALTPAGPWEEVCWESDKFVDYLELEIQLTGGMRAQRQMILARKDGFLMVADAILSQREGEIAYCATLPLGPGMSYEPEVETRDGILQARHPRGVVMPLALPEWRSDPRVGSYEATDKGIELRQTMSGRALYAPLWIDLERSRASKPRTWRQLTVAEDRKIQARDTAVGFRVHVGSQQWLIYRSMTSAANRTVLGHNLVSEFLIARFNTEGKVSALVEIEAD